MSEWLDGLRRRQRQAYAKCLARIRSLADLGHELRRPLADYLRDVIYELRTRAGRVNYRVLYSFLGKDVAVLVQGTTKEDVVPKGEIELAIRRMNLIRRDPDAHTIEFELDEEF